MPKKKGLHDSDSQLTGSDLLEEVGNEGKGALGPSSTVCSPLWYIWPLRRPVNSRWRT